MFSLQQVHIPDKLKKKPNGTIIFFPNQIMLKICVQQHK